MKQRKCRLRILPVVLALLAVLCVPALAADYQDGSYKVDFSMEGLGRHNVAWSTATVDVEGGKLYVTFTLERVDPRDHAPQYDWLKTSLGSVTPSINDASYTCTFKRVPVPSLGRVAVTAQTSAMSQPYEVEYTLVIGSDGIPEAAPSAEPSPEPTPSASTAPSAEPSETPSASPSAEPSETPAVTVSPAVTPSETPSAEPSETPAEAPSPTPSEEPAAAASEAPSEPSPSAATPSDEKPELPEKEPAPAPSPEEAVETTGESATGETGAERKSPVVPIVIAAVVVIAVVVLLYLRGAKKRKGGHE